MFQENLNGFDGLHNMKENKFFFDGLTCFEEQLLNKFFFMF